MRRRTSLFLILFVLSAAPAGAFHPIVTDDTGTQGRGGKQFELNGEYGEGPSAHGGGAQGVLTLGLTDALDAAVGVPVQYIRPHDPEAGRPRGGLADGSLELKWRLAQGRRWSLGLKPGLTMTSGDSERGFGAGRSTYRLAALAGLSLGAGELLANAAYWRNENAVGERVDLKHASLAAVVPVGPRLRLALNGALDSRRDPSTPGLEATFVAGVVVAAAPSLDVDLGWRGGDGPEAVLTGLSFRFR